MMTVTSDWMHLKAPNNKMTPNIYFDIRSSLSSRLFSIFFSLILPSLKLPFFFFLSNPGTGPDTE